MAITRVLVANRGEIAVRIIRACHDEGLAAVAVYSEPDRLASHVRDADAAVLLGPAPSSESYLDIAKLIAAARATACQAVHPGYGFLSERAAFAEACDEAGLIFVGPPASAIRAMGDKTEARRRMQAAGVPVVPGTSTALRDAVEARREAKRIGYPVLLKAAAGGGGKGMRLVRNDAEVEGALHAARREAQKAFGDGSLYVEKYLERPRHIEIQILADRHGRVVALGERECSIQRRHQKLIEEAPSSAVSPALRRRLSEAATAAASAVGYVSAGTIEFLLTPSGEFYFLEMNTRIQVEHPVTEFVYGVDLVREQLRIAAGQPMRVHGAAGPGGQLHPRGHAIECRITAEDPFNNFLPATGVLQYLHVPSGPGTRWDGGIEAGNDVTLFYDPLLAKLIAWGETREIAIQRMRRALRELVIVGLPTSQPFHLRVMDDAEFLKGDIDIKYLERAGARVLAAPARAGVDRSLAIAPAMIVEPGAGRVTPPCPHYDNDHCGGCQLQHLAYEEQLEAKRVIVGDTLRRIGKLDLPDLEIVEALEEWRYRSKISMAAKGGEGAAKAVGLHPYDRPNFVFPLADCHITDFRLMALWRELRSRLAMLPQPLTRLTLRLDREGRCHVIAESAGDPWLDADRLRHPLPSEDIICWWQPVDGAARVVAGAAA